MNASQIDAEMDNEESHVVPYVSGSIKLANIDSIGKLGFFSLNNNIGTNRSVAIPFIDIPSESTLRCIAEIDRLPRDFAEAFGVGLTIGGVRDVNSAFSKAFPDSDDISCSVSDYQVNILVPKKSEVGSQIDNRIRTYHYEILTGAAKTDIATFRSCIKAGGFLQNGHIVEAILSNTVFSVWNTKEFDMPNGIVNQVKWLGASYLTKNTRGNLFPQLSPLVAELQRSHANKGMRDSNPNWGALAGLGSLS